MLFFRKRAAAPPTPPAPASVVSIDTDALILEGNALEDAGDSAAALAAYDRVSTIDPTSWRAHLNAGNALSLLGRNLEAEKRYRRAISLNPDHAASHLNLGNALLARREYRMAAASYRDAIRLNPEWDNAWFGLGCALEETDDSAQATEAYETALSLSPAQAKVTANLARLLKKTGHSERALAAIESVLDGEPHDSASLRIKADILLSIAKPDEALDVFHRYITLNPGDDECYSDMLFATNFSPTISSEVLLAEHRRFGERLAESVLLIDVAPVKLPEKTLRIGYLSPDFRGHPVACFVDPILHHHDRTKFEVFCYYNNNADHDTVTERFKSLADGWCNISSMDDATAARRIADDSIDILVDLAGHTANNRMRLFGHKPAPVQMEWLGYLSTTGVATMDYRLCDFATDPEGIAETMQVETPLRLANSQWCYRPQIALPEVSELPMLRNGYCTFGSFNQAPKLNDAVWRAWAKVLMATPDSRLRIAGVTDLWLRDHIVALLAGMGVDEKRITHLGRIPINEYMESYGDVDVALDPFPYNGATTTCDGLIMGVPIVAVAGVRAISRGGVSLLRSLGMEDWIAAGPDSITEVVARQIADPFALAELRSSLRERMQQSPLMDEEAFTRDLEQKYRSAWRRYCAS